MHDKAVSLHIDLRGTEKRRKAHSLWSDIVVMGLMTVGLTMVLRENCRSITTPWWLLFSAGFLAGILLLSLYNTSFGKWVFPVGLAVVMLFCLVLNKRVLAGLGCIADDLMQLYTECTGKMTLDYAVSDGAQVIWGLTPLLLICVLLLSHSAWTGRCFSALIIILPIFVGLMFGLISGGVGIGLMALGTVLLLMQRTGLVRGGLPTHLAMVAAGVVICLLLGTVFGNSLNTNTAEKIRQSVHDLRYHNTGPSMPEGQLKNLPRWQKSDTPALQITMEKPEKVYLRGVIYETYTGTAWEQLDKKDMAEHESLFFWLHQGGFFGQSQIGIASKYTAELSPAVMTIENVNACREHGYYPYAVADASLFDTERLGDTELSSVEKITYLPGSISEWYGVQLSLSGAQSRGNVSSYLSLEQAYAEYVREADLQMTQDSWEVIDRQLESQDEGRTLSEIRQIISTYLENAVIYDESVRTLNGNGDFLQYVLEQSGSGYSVQYATAATLMLRYFGVPARYVEGYYLSAEEVEAYQAGETITLTENNAHAWAEYYLNGVGFVPFEVTPGYIDNEESNLGGVANQEQIYEGNQLKFARVQHPEQINEPEQDRFVFSLKPIYLLGAIPLLLLWLLIVLLLKRKKFTTAMETIQKANNRDAITLRYGYAACLMDHSSVAPPDGVERAETLNREALFSNHEMTHHQRMEMDSFADAVLTACKTSWTWLQKLRYRLWDCLY